MQKDADLVHEGEFEDSHGVRANQPYSVERRWTVDGQPAQVLDPANKPFDYEVLHLSNDTQPPFQVEYKNDPKE